MDVQLQGSLHQRFDAEPNHIPQKINEHLFMLTLKLHRYTGVFC